MTLPRLGSSSLSVFACIKRPCFYNQTQVFALAKTHHGNVPQLRYSWHVPPSWPQSSSARRVAATVKTHLRPCIRNQSSLGDLPEYSNHLHPSLSTITRSTLHVGNLGTFPKFQRDSAYDASPSRVDDDRHLPLPVCLVRERCKGSRT